MFFTIIIQSHNFCNPNRIFKREDIIIHFYTTVVIN
jgi:hypothetical protein